MFLGLQIWWKITQTVKQYTKPLQIPYHAGERHGSREDKYLKDWQSDYQEGTMHVVEICGAVGGFMVARISNNQIRNAS